MSSESEIEDYIWKVVQINSKWIGRYRNTNLINNGNCVEIQTRDGSDNRNCQSDNYWHQLSKRQQKRNSNGSCYCTGCCQSRHIQKHVLYLNDHDDDWDSTYASNYFRVPKRYLTPLQYIYQQQECGHPVDLELVKRFEKCKWYRVSDIIHQYQNDKTNVSLNQKNINQNCGRPPGGI